MYTRVHHPNAHHNDHDTQHTHTCCIYISTRVHHPNTTPHPPTQVKAAIHAAVESKRQGFDPQPEIMVPLVSIANELKSSTELVHATAKRELEALGTCVHTRLFDGFVRSKSIDAHV